MTNRRRFVPTAEQSLILDHEPVKNLLVEAGAGTGKTATLVKYAEKWNNKRGLYLAFNAAISKEAKTKFPHNVTVSTAHAYVYRRQKIKQYGNRLINKLRRRDVYALDINWDNRYLPRDRLAKAILEGITNFCNSADYRLNKYHCGLNTMDDRVFSQVLPVLKQAISSFLHYDVGELPFTHDIYLKKYEMEGKIAQEYDYIMVDEAQDLSPAMLSLIQKAEKPVIYIGDRFQSIYAFRGAIDALSRIDAKRATLTQSWRFGEPIDHVANTILQHSTRPPEWRLKGLPGHSTAFLPYRGLAPGRSFLLSRTNSRLFEGLVSIDKPFHVIGGFDALANQVLCGLALSRGETPKTWDPVVSNYYNWGDLIEDADDTDPELKRLVRIIKDYGDELPQIIERLRGKHVHDIDKAAVILSTAHKAKGLEAENVIILDDFFTLADLKEQYVSREIGEVEYNQEINLVYVAMTRAIGQLMVFPALYDEIVKAMREGTER